MSIPEAAQLVCWVIVRGEGLSKPRMQLDLDKGREGLWLHGGSPTLHTPLPHLLPASMEPPQNSSPPRDLKCGTLDSSLGIEKQT